MTPDPENDPLPEPEEGPEPWWNQDQAFQGELEMLRALKLPIVDVEKN